MKQTTILIVTSSARLFIDSNTDILQVSQPIKLTDDFHVTIETEDVSFDYLIILNKDLILNINLLGLYTDTTTIVTNFYQQSSIDHVYYVDEQDEQVDNKIKIALDHIYYGE